jgi:hypothetical protein
MNVCMDCASLAVEMGMPTIAGMNTQIARRAH